MPTVLKSLQKLHAQFLKSLQAMCILGGKLANYFHFLQGLQAICTRWKLASISARFLKTLQAFYTVSEEFANFLKRSQLQEKLTKLVGAAGLSSASGLQPLGPLG